MARPLRPMGGPGVTTFWILGGGWVDPPPKDGSRREGYQVFRLKNGPDFGGPRVDLSCDLVFGCLRWGEETPMVAMGRPREKERERVRERERERER